MPRPISRQVPLVLLSLVGATATGRAATAPPAVVHVEMMDPSSSPSVKRIMIKTDGQKVKAGPVTFEVTNELKDLVHEMIVVSVDKPNAALPYDKKEDRVYESKIKDLGEASDLKAGEKESLRLTLKPGNYELNCNQPDHYMSGMKTNLIVTP